LPQKYASAQRIQLFAISAFFCGHSFICFAQARTGWRPCKTLKLSVALRLPRLCVGWERISIERFKLEPFGATNDDIYFSRAFSLLFDLPSQK
jgi:hypothetical protein